MHLVEFESLLQWTHAVATFFMVGLIWFVQVVHYPLFAFIPESGYVAYQERHMARTGWVVGLPMLTEAATAFLLLFAPGVNGWVTWAGLGLLIGVWGVTALCSVPAHTRLMEGFDEKAHRRLVSTNWLRTIGWSLRGVCAVWLLI